MKYVTISGIDREQAKQFSSLWLPAWTGNTPEKLVSFYSKDCFYSDAAKPNGIQGQENLLIYFRKLLAKNPNWEWHQIDAIPMESGFVNQFVAKIPVEGKVLSLPGVCLVKLNEEGKIFRNEVFMDWSKM